MTRGDRILSHARAKTISITDVITAAGLGGMAIVSWFLPQKTWKGVSRLVAPLPISFALQHRENLKRIEAVIAEHPITLSPREIQLESMVGFILSNLQVLREYRPGGWKPEIKLEGVEHIEAALQQGRGAILWVAHFNAYSLIAKIALKRAGYRTSHLSLWRHGYSSTRFGLRFLNPIRTAVEERYLRERIIIEPESSKAAMAKLRERLKENAIVSITATSDAKRPAVVPFLSGEIRLAVGAPYTAYETGAALLPLIPVEETDGSFSVVIMPPLQRNGGEALSEYLDQATRRYAAIIEPYVLKKPGQWRGWYYL